MNPTFQLTEWIRYRVDVPCEVHADSTMFGKHGAYTPKEKMDYMNRVAKRLSCIKQGHILDGPLCCIMLFFINRPKKYGSKLDSHLVPSQTKPDVDGLAKVILDVLQPPKLNKVGKIVRPGAGIIHNDSQIFSLHLIKLHKRPDQESCIFIWLREYKKTNYAQLLDELI